MINKYRLLLPPLIYPRRRIRISICTIQFSRPLHPLYMPVVADQRLCAILLNQIPPCPSRSNPHVSVHDQAQAGRFLAAHFERERILYFGDIGRRLRVPRPAASLPGSTGADSEFCGDKSPRRAIRRLKSKGLRWIATCGIWIRKVINFVFFRPRL